MKVTPPDIAARQLGFGFASGEVLRGLELHVPAGTVLGVLGRSGSGKSTLLQLLMGLLSESAGEVRFDGQPLSPKERRGRGGYVPQRPSLLPWRTVLENLLLPADLRAQSRPPAQAEALALLERFGLLGAAELWPHQLSGGMAQRIAVLRAALFAPQLLFLDEPFSALDALTRLEFQRWLAQLQRSVNATTVLITHDVREALTLCHQVVVLSGRPARVSFCAQNTPSQNPDPALEAALLRALLEPS